MLEERKKVKSLAISLLNFATSMRGAYGITMTLFTVFVLSSIILLVDGCKFFNGGYQFKHSIETNTLLLLEKKPNHHNYDNALRPPFLHTPLILRKNHLLRQY